MQGWFDYLDRLNRELDEDLASGRITPEAIAIVAEQERTIGAAVYAAAASLGKQPA